jgi:low temperature requirement protein LtrA
MTSPAQSVQREAVSPLELFFDLVFVFAVSQLSHHLLDHLTWRGAAETLVLLIAVFGIWSGTSFEATLLNIGRSPTRWLLLAVMLVGLFMNAAIADAFETGGWAFVVPLLVIQAGRSILMVVAAPTRMLREHYARLLCWILATAPLWIAGAISEAESRPSEGFSNRSGASTAKLGWARNAVTAAARVCSEVAKGTTRRPAMGWPSLGYGRRGPG